MWTPGALDAAKGLWKRIKRRKTWKIDTKEVATLSKKDNLLRDMPAEMITAKLRAWRLPHSTAGLQYPLEEVEYQEPRPNADGCNERQSIIIQIDRIDLT